MDAIERKFELEAEKADIDTRISTLQTKDGAEAFIANQKAGIDTVLTQLQDRKLPDNRISMKQFLQINRKLLDEHPTEIVTQELSRVQRHVVEIDKETVENPISPIERERH